MVPDTHAHLDDSAFADDLDNVLLRAAHAGVGPVLAVGSDLNSSEKAVDLAQEHQQVFAGVGVHPHDAGRFAAMRAGVEALLSRDKVVAVGEIGLDYVRSEASHATQRDVFGAQLRWAADRNVPVSVHNRDADDDVLAAVEGIDIPVILHCFSGDAHFAERALHAGCFVSFAGNITFKRAQQIRDAARVVAPDRLLVETDSPVLSPEPLRGRRNEPANVRRVVEALAEIRGEPAEQIEQQVAANAARVLQWEAV